MKGEKNMKKLTKVHTANRDTIEAYFSACSCSNDCYYTCYPLCGDPPAGTSRHAPLDSPIRETNRNRNTAFSGSTPK